MDQPPFNKNTLWKQGFKMPLKGQQALKFLGNILKEEQKDIKESLEHFMECDKSLKNK